MKQSYTATGAEMKTDWDQKSGMPAAAPEEESKLNHHRGRVHVYSTMESITRQMHD